MATPRTVGYQPRNTPAERRAFYDQQRQIAKNADDALTEADADARYVNTSGDTMTGTLIVDAGPGLRLQRDNDSPYLSFAKRDGTRIAYIQGHSSNNLLVYNDIPNGQIQFYTDDAGGVSKVRLNIHDQGVTLTNGSFHVYSTALANLLHVDDTGVAVDRDPTVPLQVATKQYVDTTAGGIVAYAQVTASQASITTEVDLTGLNGAFTATANRYYKITGSVQPSSTVAGDTIRWHIFEGGALVQASVVHTNSTAGHTSQRSVVLTGLSGARTCKLRMERNTGTGTVTSNASATGPAFILVEDLGIL